MRQKEIFFSGIRSVLSHKLRSFLTLAGIIIGVAAVITIFSSVSAMKTLINNTISGMGYDNVIMLYSTRKDTDDEELKYKLPNRFKYLDYSDYEALRENLENVKIIYPYINERANTVINQQKKRIRVYGVGSEYYEQKPYEIDMGRNFLPIEEREGQNVCILGASLKEDYYSGRNPVGEKISFGNISVKIIGVMKQSDYNKNMRMNQWEKRRDQQSIFVPTKFTAKYFRKQMRVDEIVMQAKDYNSVGPMYNKARQIILARHKMAHDIEVVDISQRVLEIRNSINDFMKNWNIILVAIASISLLTGGLGLFSILLISIKERMTEIGIRNSIGAKNKDIFAHFLYESISLALFGGIIGAGIAVLIIQILSAKLQIPVDFPILGLVVGLLFALIVGFLSGFYPSYKAAKIDPVRAIFYYT